MDSFVDLDVALLAVWRCNLSYLGSCDGRDVQSLSGDLTGRVSICLSYSGRSISLGAHNFLAQVETSSLMDHRVDQRIRMDGSGGNRRTFG